MAAQDVPGFDQLPRARRWRVRVLSALQERLSRASSPGPSRVPRGVIARLARLTAPVRWQGPNPEAGLPIELDLPRPAPTAGAPRASLILPVYGRLELALRTIATLRTFTSVPYELWVVDDATPGVDRDWLSRHLQPNESCLRHEHNRGFPAAVNTGLALARAPYVVVLNSDIVVTPGWLERLLAPLAASATVGLTGPVTNDSGDIATISVRYRTLSELLALSQARSTLPAQPVKKLSLLCAALRRSELEEIGGLDEGYGRGMFDDDDLCMTLRRRGQSILLMRDTFVHHEGGASFRELPADEYLARFEINRRRFEQKWHTRWPAD